MRIAHIGEYDPDKAANGVDKVISILCRLQVKLGHQVYIYSLDVDSGDLFIEEMDGIIIVHLPKSRAGGFWLSHAAKEYIKANDDGIEIYHLHSVYTPQNCMLSRILKAPYVLTPHGGYSPSGKRRSIISFTKKSLFEIFFEGGLLKNAGALHALTDNEKRHLERMAEGTAVFVVPNGVEAGEILNHKQNLNENRLHCPLSYFGTGEYMAYCGRLDIKHKGIDLLIKAFLEGKRKGWAQNYRLILIGPGKASEVQRIKRMIHRYGLDDSVILAGCLFGRDKAVAMANAKIYMQCSRWEGLSLSILEAIELGRPVVVTENTNMGYWLKKYGYGLVVKCRIKNIREGLELMCEKVKDSAYMKKTAEKANLVMKEFDWNASVRDICSEYEKIINK